MTLRVATLGMDDRSRAALDLVFKGPGKGAFSLAEEPTAQATIVDLDGPGAADLWANYRRRFPDRPTVALSIREPSISDAVILRKPLRIADLLRSLEDIARGADRAGSGTPAPVPSVQGKPGAPGVAPAQSNYRQTKSSRGATLAMERGVQAGYSQAIADAPEVDLRNPDELQKLFFSVEEYAGGRVIREVKAALSDGIAREISAWGGHIVVLPGPRRVLTDLSDARLKQFAFVRLTGLDAPEQGLLPFELRSRLLRDADQVKALEQAPPRGMQATSTEAFLWKLTAWIARGRMPLGGNPTLPVVLRHWPNLTRLLLLPNAMRIAALWMAQPRSAFSSARALKVPLSHVLTFYSAAHAIGLVALPKRQVDFLFQPEPVAEHRSRGLLGRILDKLRGFARHEDT
jgi:hypothetical protein